MFTEDMKTYKHKVKYILTVYPETRDSDKKLWLRFMCIAKDLHTEINFGTFENFCDLLLDKETPTFETLSRCRRKIQEMCEDLRGELYHDRQYEQIEVRKHLKEF